MIARVRSGHQWEQVGPKAQERTDPQMEPSGPALEPRSTKDWLLTTGSQFPQTAFVRAPLGFLDAPLATGRLRGEPVSTYFMTPKQTAEYLNMSVQWVYREAPKVGLVPYRFGNGRNAKLQFKVADVHAWVKQQRLPGD
ncbi:helix-turn-helix domain-containing protein [Kitasatospora sp. NPDC089509]|uniref:helix-turn-helix domain-containing protein n=1 Tax=Kitasatospora sp. NPDC089509 TaxID=3364079 RepID=UPI00382CF6B3